MDEQQLIDEIMQDSETKARLAELGMENESQERQEEILTMAGELCAKRVAVEILKRIPESERDDFVSLVGSGKYDEFKSKASAHVADLDDFIHDIARKEFLEIAEGIHRLREE